MRQRERTWGMLGSFGFAAILLVFLLLLTWVGTLEQVEFGLYDVQKKYFDSLFVVHHAGPFEFRAPGSDSAEPLFTIPEIPVPLPGVNLLLGLLLLNLVVGGLIRIRKDRRTVGIIVAHVGIVIMLVAGFVKFRWSTEGNLLLWPDQRGSEYENYQDWQIAISEAVPSGTVTERLIPISKIAAGNQTKPLVFAHESLPFELTITRYWRNTWIFDQGTPSREIGPSGEEETIYLEAGAVIDGYFLGRQKDNTEAEFNMAGAYATFREKDSGRTVNAILWSDPIRRAKRDPRRPFTLTAGGKQWFVELRKEIFALPFEIRLDKFTFELHPGTGSPKVFLSDVTKFEGDREQALKITMNEPLRHGGYTLYQSSYGPKDVRPGDAAYSVFSVVNNPSDQWPKWSCYIIAVGLLWHFAGRLVRYVKSQHPKPVEPIQTSNAAPAKSNRELTARTHS